MFLVSGMKFWAVAISPQNVNSLFFRIALIAVACGTPVAYRVGYLWLKHKRGNQSGANNFAHNFARDMIVCA